MDFIVWALAKVAVKKNSPATIRDHRDIVFVNQDIAFEFVGRRDVSRWVKAAAAKEGFSLGAIAVVFTSDAYLLEVNRKYLGHDHHTDIITFDYCDPLDRSTISGDLLISVETVARNADSFEVSMRDEMLRVIIHGIMHLCGYKDKTSEEIAVMRAREDHYLTMFTEVFADRR
ncbi:endoribonuclease YbeY [Bacteroidia bacterium]|nr:endoribonuclease YbeY [Bacteroidia bacterium]